MPSRLKKLCVCVVYVRGVERKQEQERGKQVMRKRIGSKETEQQL